MISKKDIHNEIQKILGLKIDKIVIIKKEIIFPAQEYKTKLIPEFIKEIDKIFSELAHKKLIPLKFKLRKLSIDFENDDPSRPLFVLETETFATNLISVK